MLSVISLKIPSNWNELYYKILTAFAQYGEEALKDCKATCTEKNTHIVDCYNIFNAAVAAYNVGKTKQANLLYNYIVKQFEIYYPNIKINAKTGYFVVLTSELNAILSTKTDEMRLEIMKGYFTEDTKISYVDKDIYLTDITGDDGVFIYTPDDEIEHYVEDGVYDVDPNISTDAHIWYSVAVPDNTELIQIKLA